MTTKSWKNHPKKLLRIPQIHFFSLAASTAQMAQTEEFMFQNVAYWPTVYRTGPEGIKMAKISSWIGNSFSHLQMKTFSHFNFCHSRWNSFCWAERNSSCPLATHCKLTKHFGTMKLQYITPCESQMLCRWPQHNRRGNIQCP